MLKNLKESERLLKLNLQHFASTGVSGIAIGVSNFYSAPVEQDDEKGIRYGQGMRTRFLQEIEVDRPQESEDTYGDDIVAATAVSNGKLEVKTTFVTVPSDQKAFLSGAKKGSGGYKYSAADIPPDVGVVFERRNHDGSSEWVGLFKGKFTRPGIKGQSKQDKVEFQNDEVEGSFIDRIYDEASHVTGYDAKGETKGRDYVFIETFGKTYEEFMETVGSPIVEEAKNAIKPSENTTGDNSNTDDSGENNIPEA